MLVLHPCNLLHPTLPLLYFCLISEVLTTLAYEASLQTRVFLDEPMPTYTLTLLLEKELFGKVVNAKT